MPGLLTLHTDLKSLKYGQDQPGGGDSGQPYIKTDINSTDTTINKIRLTRFDDGLIRGGIVGATNAAITDTLRIGKFLTDFPKGPLFIVKQVGLQLTNPRVESSTQPTNKATSGQGFLNNAINFVSNTANKIENAVGPTRIYNLGINTLAQVPVNAIGGHIVRHGFLPNNDDSKYYENVIKIKNFQNDTNRLVDLTNNFNLGPWGSNKLGVTKKEQGFLNKLAGAVSTNPMGGAIFGAATAIFNTNKELEIDSYLGGANSVYGIGVTTIHRAMDSDTENKEKIDFARVQSVALAGKTRDDKNQPAEIEFGLDRLLGASNYASSSLGRFYFNTNQSAIVNDDDYIPINLKDKRASVFDPHDNKERIVLDQTYINNANDISKPSIYYGLATGGTTGSSLDGLNRLDLPNVVYTGSNKISDIVKTVESLAVPNNLGIYSALIHGAESQSLNGERLPNSDKSKSSPTYTNYYGDKPIVITSANGSSWADLTREKRVGSGRKDEINLTPIFTAPAGTHADTVTIGGVTRNINDLVKFRIQAIDSNDPTAAKWMIFRAYITDLSDNVDATWNPVKYAGRGDQFYIYDSFTRKMSVSFKVASLSRQEMEPMYQKLNFLMSNLMPDYSTKYNDVYSSQGLLMKGPIMRMTIGNWIDGQLCKFDSLSYKVPQDSPWEIGLGDQELILPHIVDVTLSFTPIGSQTRDKNELPRKADCVSNIAQNYNAGSTDKREYIIPCDDPAPPKPKEPDPVPTPPVPPPPPPLPPPEIPPAYDQTTGTALQGINNPGKEPKFGSPAQERAYLKLRFGTN